jgi:hypothetical protein
MRRVRLSAAEVSADPTDPEGVGYSHGEVAD